jgi:hypothetical protein
MSELTPAMRAEIAAVADQLDRFGLGRNATRLRLVLGERGDDEKPCPVQDDAGQIKAIPWGLAEILYPAYGHGQTLEHLAERGGFGRSELGSLAADCYSGNRNPQLRRMPLLDLYEMAKAGRLQEKQTDE